MAHDPDPGAHPYYFSVIIPSYNRAQLIGRALDSVFQQTLPDYEVIVVDDASTDDTRQIVASYGARAGFLASPQRRGPGAARNVGLVNARGRYAVFLDSDDLLLPWALATYKDAIEGSDYPALVMGNFRRFREEIELRELAAAPLKADVWDDYLQPASAEYKLLMCFAMRMDVLRESGGFAEQNICSEGHDLFLRVGTAKGFVYIHAPTVYAYRQHSFSQSRDVSPLYKGARLMLASEKRGAYPGGIGRRLERSIFLSRMLKYSIGRCLEQGAQRRALELYLRGLPYFRRSGYWPYNARPLAFMRKLRKRNRRSEGIDGEVGFENRGVTNEPDL